MDLFARCFLLVFSELYLGGLLALSVPPFHHIERGFYKSTAAVYLGMGVLAFGGRIALLVHAPVVAGSEIMELALWAVSLPPVTTQPSAS